MVSFQKCLTTMDLTSLGVGSCVGTGMYLVAGMVAKNVAGPGVVISFVIAAVASIFSGMLFRKLFLDIFYIKLGKITSWTTLQTFGTKLKNAGITTLKKLDSKLEKIAFLLVRLFSLKTLVNVQNEAVFQEAG